MSILRLPAKIAMMLCFLVNIGLCQESFQEELSSAISGILNDDEEAIGKGLKVLERFDTVEEFISSSELISDFRAATSKFEDQLLKKLVGKRDDTAIAILNCITLSKTNSERAVATVRTLLKPSFTIDRRFAAIKSLYFLTPPKTSVASSEEIEVILERYGMNGAFPRQFLPDASRGARIHLRLASERYYLLLRTSGHAKSELETLEALLAPETSKAKRLFALLVIGHLGPEAESCRVSLKKHLKDKDHEYAFATASTIALLNPLDPQNDSLGDEANLGHLAGRFDGYLNELVSYWEQETESRKLRYHEMNVKKLEAEVSGANELKTREALRIMLIDPEIARRIGGVLQQLKEKATDDETRKLATLILNSLDK